ncbi:AAA family ATPase, putative [Plasmodium ovale]|uniref:AAA family ATPase, putative n=1 Tax=Plasmodium ovale TaxID=36330 RepID=A0A1C3KMJ1_PLAOA|nr:AAA family ATPase, putative [Plasmodium ovale]
MKGRGDKKTSIEQVMSDYLINLSQFYKNGHPLNDNDNNDRKLWMIGKKNNLKMERMRQDVHLLERKGSSHSSSSSSGISTNADLSDSEKSRSIYYEELMNTIFTVKEREIYLNIQKIINDEKMYTDLESNEYLFCYLFILAIKKMFYDIISQKKLEHSLEKSNEMRVNGTHDAFPPTSYYASAREDSSHDKENKWGRNLGGENERRESGSPPQGNTYCGVSGEEESDAVDKNGGDSSEAAPDEGSEIRQEQGSGGNSGAGDSGGGGRDDFKKCSKSETQVGSAYACRKSTEKEGKLTEEPPAGEPPAGEPPAGEPPAGEPPTEEPPTGETVKRKEKQKEASAQKGTGKTKKNLRNNCENFDKKYITFLFDTLKNNKSYWLVPLSVVSCVYIYYKTREKITSFLYSHYVSVSKYIWNILLGDGTNVGSGVGKDSMMFRDYNHFFYNINKNNVKTIFFNPSNNTFSYVLNKGMVKNTNMMLYNLSRVTNSNNNDGINHMYTIYYNDFIMKYLLKNKLYENIEIRLDENMLKSSLYNLVKRNLFDIITYTCSLFTCYYIYSKNISPLNVDSFYENRCKFESMNEIILNDNTKKDIKAVLFFLLYSKLFNDDNFICCSTILFTGETGTGKSLLAKTIAKELNFDFVHISGSTFIELYIGNGASKIRNLFKRAKKNKKSVVIFIDEIDSIGMNRNFNDSSTSTNQEYTQTLNQLLIEIDTLHEYNKEQLLQSSWKEETPSSLPHSSPHSQPHSQPSSKCKPYSIITSIKKVIRENIHQEEEQSLNEKDRYEILHYYLNNNSTLQEVEDLFNLRKYKTEKFILFIAATNRYKFLDSALIRSKRFDKIVHFHLPNMFTRKKLFSFYMEKYLRKGRGGGVGGTASTSASISPIIRRKAGVGNSTGFGNVLGGNAECGLFRGKFGGNLRPLPFGSHFKYSHLFGSLNRHGRNLQGGSSITVSPPVDLFTLSMLTHSFNCADIDQLVGSVRIKSLTKNTFNRIYNVNSLLLENILSVLHKKFTYDNHLEKIIRYKDTEDTAPSHTLKMLTSAMGGTRDCEELVAKFANYCTSELGRRMREREEAVQEAAAQEAAQKVAANITQGTTTHQDANRAASRAASRAAQRTDEHNGAKIAPSDLLFFRDVKKMKTKLWDDEDLGVLQNAFCMNPSFMQQGKNYHLVLLWKSVEGFFTSLHLSYQQAVK